MNGIMRMAVLAVLWCVTSSCAGTGCASELHCQAVYRGGAAGCGVVMRCAANAQRPARDMRSDATDMRAPLAPLAGSSATTTYRRAEHPARGLLPLYKTRDAMAAYAAANAMALTNEGQGDAARRYAATGAGINASDLNAVQALGTDMAAQYEYAQTPAQAPAGELAASDAAGLNASIAESTGAQLAALDVTGLQAAADELAGAGAFDVRGVLEQLSAGEGLDAQQLCRAALELMAGMLRGRATFMIALITGAVLAGVAARLCGDGGARVAMTASLCIAAALIAADFAALARDARAALAALGAALDALLPLISGALAAMGAGVTSGLLGGTLSALAGAGLRYGREYVVGLALMSAALELCAGLNPRVRLGALAELMRTASGLMVGAALVVALGAISINGTLGAGMDGVSLRAAKYALDNMVPVVGGEIKDTVEVMAASCLMVQNLLGVCGMLLMVVGMTRPVLMLTAAYLSYKACSAAAQALGGAQLGSLCEGIARVLRTLMIAVLGAAAIAIMLLGALNASAGALLAA